jgi:hypothetical protein
MCIIKWRDVVFSGVPNSEVSESIRPVVVAPSRRAPSPGIPGTENPFCVSKAVPCSTCSIRGRFTSVRPYIVCTWLYTQCLVVLSLPPGSNIELERARANNHDVFAVVRFVLFSACLVISPSLTT